MKNSTFLLSITLSVLLGFTSIVKAQQMAELGDGSSAYISMNSQTLVSLDDYEINPANLEFSKYGGWKGRQTTATGFFRVEKIDGRWWAIDPEGYYYIHKALNSVNTSNDFTLDQAHKVLDDNGFNGMGNWSNEETIESPLDENKPLAYCPRYSFIAEYRRQRDPRIEMPVFDDEFEAFANEGAKAFAKYIDDPQVFGYFSDNELPWRGHGLTAHTKLTDTSDKNYITAINFLEARGKTKDNWNEEDEFAYMALMSERYYSIVSKAIKAVDPNHMFIGSRCHSIEKRVEGFVRNAGKYVDVFSNNHYSRWGARDFEINNMANWSGRPLMMTEFYSMEVTPGTTVVGAGFKVRNQVSRGLFYQNYVTTLAENKAIVGMHWFKFQDDDNGNKGVVDKAGNLQRTVLNDMKEVNTHLYDFIDYADSRPEPIAVLIPEADAYYQGNTNHNDHELLGKFSTNNSFLREIYLRFDLSSLPEDLSLAKIKLFSISGGSEISNYQAELVTNDNWNESTINKSNSPDGSTILAKWSAGGDITIDVTEEIRDALDDNNKLSIRIICTLANNKTVQYASSEHPNASVRPKLMVFSNTNVDYVPIPALIQAEDFTSQSGTTVEPSQDTDNDSSVGFIDTGDFLSYNISVPTSEEYTIRFRVASKDNGTQFNILEDNTVVGRFSSPATGGWYDWETVNINVNLTEGDHKLKLLATGSGWNINWLDIKEDNTLSDDEFETSGFEVYPNPVSGRLNIKTNTLETSNYEIVNSLGMIIYSGNLSKSENKIDMSNLNQGIYFLRLRNQKISAIKKIIKN